MRVSSFFGIIGVEQGETALARRWARRLEWPVVAMVLWIPIQWYLEETGMLSSHWARFGDWLIWQVFLFETVLLTSLVNNKWRYLAGNWMNLLIIVGGVPIVWDYTPLVGLLRSLRLVLVLVLVLRLSKTLRKLLMRNQLGTTLAVALGVVLLAGIIITRLDPSIGTVWDGMWWAWVTVTTVGYGDMVPVSPAGRLFGGILILFGVVMISLLTANLSAFLIGGEVGKVEQEERSEDAALKDIAQRLQHIEQLLEQQQVNRSGRQTADEANPD